MLAVCTEDQGGTLAEPPPLEATLLCNLCLKRRLRRTARLAAEQCRLLSLEDPEDLATFAARRRRFPPESIESTGPPKRKKEQRVPSSSGGMHLTGVSPTLPRSALAVRMVAAGKPSRGNPQEPAGSDTGASLLHASGPQSYGVVDCPHFPPYRSPSVRLQSAALTSARPSAALERVRRWSLVTPNRRQRWAWKPT